MRVGAGVGHDRHRTHAQRQRLLLGTDVFRSQLSLGQWRLELDWVGPKVARPLRTQARMLQARLCEDEHLWAKALTAWQDLRADAAHVPGGTICLSLCAVTVAAHRHRMSSAPSA